jgi:hypothetical protein
MNAPSSSSTTGGLSCGSWDWGLPTASDARTIWLFREKLTQAGAIKTLFERFDATLRQAGYIAMAGQIVDASLIAAPRQHNNEDEKQAIKGGRIPGDWKDNPAKLRQNDCDSLLASNMIDKRSSLPTSVSVLHAADAILNCRHLSDFRNTRTYFVRHNLKRV